MLKRYLAIWLLRQAVRRSDLLRVGLGRFFERFGGYDLGIGFGDGVWGMKDGKLRK